MEHESLCSSCHWEKSSPTWNGVIPFFFSSFFSHSQAVPGVWGWPPAAAVGRCAFRGHRLVGVHLHPEGSATCATLRREAKVPQHSARGAGWDLRGEVRGVAQQGLRPSGLQKQRPPPPTPPPLSAIHLIYKIINDVRQWITVLSWDPHCSWMISTPAL